MQVHKFSLILATYGRYKEVDSFLNSILDSDFDLTKVEVIIVDQNSEINLTEIINRYKVMLDIKHIQSLEKGLSVNRNKGLLYASGDIIAFPDDDCEYLTDTLYEVNKAFNEYKEYGLILGRIVDRENNDSLRVWPKVKMNLNRNNFYTKLSSITMFYKNDIFKELSFNEKLGVGSVFGSCEDADIIYKTIKSKKVLYTPSIKLYHPNSDGMGVPENKIFNYGMGFGAFVKENLDFATLFILFQAIGYHLFNMVYSLILLDGDKSKRRYLALKSRIKGFLSYKSENPN